VPVHHSSQRLNTIAATDRHRVIIDAPFHIDGVPITGSSTDSSLSSEGGARDTRQETSTTHGILPADETESQVSVPTSDTQPWLGVSTILSDTAPRSHSIIPADHAGLGIHDSPEHESSHVTEPASDPVETHKPSITEASSIQLPITTPMRTPSTREPKPPDRLTLVCMAHITAKRALRDDEENARTSNNVR
jgi:hypothetical protein